MIKNVALISVALVLTIASLANSRVVHKDKDAIPPPPPPPSKIVK